MDKQILIDNKEVEYSFSIIMVSLNAVETVRLTVESVLSQKNVLFEFIIVDGMSDDGTFDVIKEYSSDSRISIIREKDCGIYDAMNKGVKRAKGKYIYFLGCGDCFANDKVLYNVFKISKKYKFDVICGNIQYLYENNTKLINYCKKRTLLPFLRASGIPTSHQAFFVKTSFMKEYNFDINYVFCADQDVLAYCLKQKNTKYTYANLIICVVDPYGFSSDVPKNTIRKEYDRINYNHNRIWYYLLFFPKLLVRLFNV